MTSSRRGWRDHPLVQLTLVRYREFYREPEAVFWVFIFPVLLTAGLGIAFRSRPPERTPVALVADGARTDTLGPAPRARRTVSVRTLAEPAPPRRSARATSRWSWCRTTPAVEYRYDPERPGAREARLRVDEALQRAAGRTDPVRASERTVREAGARYVDFVVPGLLGMNLMGSGIWGIGFAIVDARRKHLLKRLMATPMSRTQYLASFVLSRLTFLDRSRSRCCSASRCWPSACPLRGSLASCSPPSACSPPSRSRRSGCCSPRGRGRSKACPA